MWSKSDSNTSISKSELEVMFKRMERISSLTDRQVTFTILANED